MKIIIKNNSDMPISKVTELLAEYFSDKISDFPIRGVGTGYYRTEKVVVNHVRNPKTLTIEITPEQKCY